MNQKIVIVHDGSKSDLFPLLSLIIGLHKKHPQAQIIWAGDVYTASLIRYNNRIHKFININQEFTVNTLKIVFNADICVNVSLSKKARDFTNKTSAQTIIGFDKKGPTSSEAEFFEKIIRNKIFTKKTILQLFYDLADLNWKGEGYGLTYYPKTKQSLKCGHYMENYDGIIDEFIAENCQKIIMPKSLLHQLDNINIFSKIITDDLFTAQAGIALRKECTLYASLPYEMEFFGKGKMHEITEI